MSECTDLREALLDWADGRGDTSGRRGVEEHLASCAACRKTAERLGATLPATGSQGLDLGRVDVPDAVLVEMRAELQRRLDALEPRAAAQNGPGLMGWLFSGSLSVPKPFAWAAVVLAFVVWSSQGQRAVTPVSVPVRALPAVLMDGVDRLGISDETAQG